uniref:Uncharacterized protein n=1 Tax=Anguilla anguilla TaxID=7936 RepID=A0A0E9SL82_ANGAN
MSRDNLLQKLWKSEKKMKGFLRFIIMFSMTVYWFLLCWTIGSVIL